MLTPEGNAHDLKASFCGLEDDLTDFKNRAIAHAMRGHQCAPDPRPEPTLEERLLWHDITPYSCFEGWMERVWHLV
jgi:hypothetical protein